MEVEPPPSISGALNPTSLKAIIHACRAAKTNREQFAYIRKMIAMVNTELRTIQTNMQPFSGATAENPVDCYYEVDIHFLHDPSDDSTETLFLFPTDCNKIEISLSLVNAKRQTQRFQVGAMTQMMEGASSLLSVNSLPNLSPESFGAASEQTSKKVTTPYYQNQAYFSRMGIGGLLFNLTVVVMAMAKQKMEVLKYNKNTDRLCVPYEVIYEFYEENDEETCAYDWTKFESSKKILYDAIHQNQKASENACYIEMYDDTAKKQFEAYLQVMTDNVIAYTGQLKKKMGEKSTGINLVRTYVPFCVYYA